VVGLCHRRNLRHRKPGKVTHVRLKNVKTGARTELPADGVFIAIGHAPATELILGQIKLKPSGYVEVAPNSTATLGARRVRRRRRRRRNLPAGSHGRRLGCMAALEAERFLALRASDAPRRRSSHGSNAQRKRYGLDKLKVFHAAAEAAASPMPASS